MSDGALAGLYALQRNRRRRWLATAVALVLGLGLASVHWSGLLLGGVLVGWTWPTLGRAVLAGLAFGVLALGAFALTLWLSGTLDAALAMGPITMVTVAIPLVLGLLGGASRGLVNDAPSGAADMAAD